MKSRRPSGPGAEPSVRWRRIGVKAVAAAVVALLVLVGLPHAARRLEFFRVRRIEFVGMRHLERSRALAALGLRPDANIFDDAAPLERRLVAMPGVKAAAVDWRLPGTLMVTLDEWIPVALAPAEGRLALVDRTGRILPFDPTVSAPDLPVVPVNDRITVGALARVQAVAPTLFVDVATAWRVGDDVILVARHRRLWFGPTVSAEEIRAVMTVANDLAQRGHEYAELDGRFAGQVIVRGLHRGPDV